MKLKNNLINPLLKKVIKKLPTVTNWTKANIKTRKAPIVMLLVKAAMIELTLTYLNMIAWMNRILLNMERIVINLKIRK